MRLFGLVVAIVEYWFSCDLVICQFVVGLVVLFGLCLVVWWYFGLCLIVLGMCCSHLNIDLFVLYLMWLVLLSWLLCSLLCLWFFVCFV